MVLVFSDSSVKNTIAEAKTMLRIHKRIIFCPALHWRDIWTGKGLPAIKQYSATTTASLYIAKLPDDGMNVVARIMRRIVVFDLDRNFTDTTICFFVILPWLLTSDWLPDVYSWLDFFYGYRPYILFLSSPPVSQIRKD